ncbi:hypothetical protein [Pedobacter frigiditerrae]|uniref:hypothetical protein n=1 Tax=Pedobacter frigiditerrae TaxID=2530452 RepID=UPI00292E767D|nr:hypothetical protein [Pedobacter frigiditerrae]
MKKLMLVAMLGIASLLNNTATAQININISAQPLWGPTGYDHVDYYYLPDVDSYYSVPKRQFVYLNNGNWVFNNTLPARYSSYNLYNGYKVVVNGDRPYLNYNTDKVKYAKFKNYGGKQLVIKNSNDKKYYVVKGHPHGMPPGQAKKIYSGNAKGKVIMNSPGKGNNGKGNNGNGKGKH